MTTYAVGQRVRVMNPDRDTFSDIGVIVRESIPQGMYIVSVNGLDEMFDELELEPAPDAQTTLTQALEALRETDKLLTDVCVSLALMHGITQLAPDVQARIDANRTLLQAASQPTDDADAAAGSEGS